MPKNHPFCDGEEDVLSLLSLEIEEESRPLLGGPEKLRILLAVCAVGAVAGVVLMHIEASRHVGAPITSRLYVAERML